MVSLGQAREDDRIGNDLADEAADLVRGGRSVDFGGILWLWSFTKGFFRSFTWVSWFTPGRRRVVQAVSNHTCYMILIMTGAPNGLVCVRMYLVLLTLMFCPSLLTY